METSAARVRPRSPTRLTFGPPASSNPIWSPDGRYVAYFKGGPGIYRKLSDGTSGEELLLRTTSLAVPKSWSPDGHFILYAQINPATRSDLARASHRA